jgi:LDH2 family malate/lactate/ureidoglycolate dehydrogenase
MTSRIQSGGRPLDRLQSWTSAVFEACDLPADAASLAARMLVRSEARGYKTHGLGRIPSYVDRIQAGDFNARPRMEHRSFAGGVVLEADGAMGQLAGPHAVTLGLAALQTSASVLVAIRECGHLGALGIHALLAAEAGAFCLIGQRTPPLLAMEGFSRPAIGHNPIAFGCPLPSEDPIVFDIACSVAARGHILLAAREGKPIPSGWAVDEAGMPTTDAQRALSGALLPVGGHKGVGLSMLVECLAGAMAASAASLPSMQDPIPASGAVGRQGGFVWMVRPGAFVDESLFSLYMRQWTRHYLDSGGDHGRLPGARGARLEADARAGGLRIAPSIETELVSLGDRLDIPFPAALRPEGRSQRTE